MTENPTIPVPDGWPFADEATNCAVCGKPTSSHSVEHLGLMATFAFKNGLSADQKKAHTGDPRFVCCHSCWEKHDMSVLKMREELTEKGERSVLDDEVVEAASKVDAKYVALNQLSNPYEDENWPEYLVDQMEDEAREMERMLSEWQAQHNGDV